MRISDWSSDVCSSDLWNRMIDVNIRGVLHGIHSILDHMMARGSGTIINIASTAAHESSAAGSVYSATKYAVKAISEGLRKETNGKVRVSMISPGFTGTELFDGVVAEDIKRRVRSEARRVGKEWVSQCNSRWS